VIIEKEIERCRELSVALKETLVLHGDGTSRGLLVEEEVGNFDAFLALTQGDETNIMACLLAKGLGVNRSIALVRRGDYLTAARDVGLDVAVSPRRSTASYILAHVRSDEVSRVVSVENGMGEILEIQVPGRARVLERSLMYVEIPRGAQIACIVRDREVFVPRGTDQIVPGDVVVLFTLPEVREDVLRLFRDPSPEPGRA
jgi:trk system potassium uptake protein TrkA